ncbi:MAG: hypothetical protein P1U63_09640 [Coxiellaceae bacterium]|nr:hypothetical protein [Coxiellaceae bacterium]
MKKTKLQSSDYGSVYYCYGKPRPGGRTGHGALLVLKKGVDLTRDSVRKLTEDDVAYYFSMYPNTTPDVIAKATMVTLLSTLYPAVTVDSFTDDVQMRRRSEVRLQQAIKDRAEKKRLEALAKNGDADAAEQAEKIHPAFEVDNVENLIKSLSDETHEDLQQYFEQGMFNGFVKLPSNLNVQAVVDSLETTKKNAPWTMFAPIPDLIPKRLPVNVPNRGGQNCCSAITLALKAGGLDLKPSYHLRTFSTTLEIGLWASFFTLLLSKPDEVFSKQVDASKLLLLPLALAGVRFVTAMKNARGFYQDVCSMTKDPSNVGLKTKLILGSAISSFNSMACLLNPNAWSTIIVSPITTWTEMKKLNGAQVIEVPKDLSVSLSEAAKIPLPASPPRPAM